MWDANFVYVVFMSIHGERYTVHVYTEEAAALEYVEKAINDGLNYWSEKVEID